MPASDLLERARAAKPGTCLICGCTWHQACRITITAEEDRKVGRRPCAWVKGTGSRLCDAHPSHEIAAASLALKAVDAEATVHA